MPKFIGLLSSLGDLFVNRNIESLRALCADNQRGLAPYALRTRFERSLLGLVTQYSQSVFGAVPGGLSRLHLERFLHRCCGPGVSTQFIEPIVLATTIFERFTYLCDTSNWSSDGQDPRIEMCREDVLRLCELVNAGTLASPLSGSRSSF
jgi:hypothetical protein